MPLFVTYNVQMHTVRISEPYQARRRDQIILGYSTKLVSDRNLSHCQTGPDKATNDTNLRYTKYPAPSTDKAVSIDEQLD